MAQKCPSCGTPVSKKWLLLGSPDQPYQCVQCKAWLGFTWKRYLVSFLAGLIGALPILLVFFYQFVSWKLFLFYYLVILLLDTLLVLNMPGQFRIEVNNQKVEGSATEE